jgi:3D (Asp-Asp-Asp) domain-containing protein
MAHRRRAIVATLVALVIAQTLAFSAPKDAPPEPVVDLELVPNVEILAAPRSVERIPALVVGPVANPVFTVRATAYNSLESQTNSQPFITATGARTSWGIIAVSRDLLGSDLPYGSLVRLTDLGGFRYGRGAGAYQALLDANLFVVEDTMHPRKTGQIDLWFADYASAVAWGVRRLEVEVVRYGRDGPLLDAAIAEHGFHAPATWLASR